MGTIAARHAWEILKNTENVLAIEMLAAAQGIDFHEHQPGIGTRAAHTKIRESVPHVTDDRVLYNDIETVRDLLVSGEILRVVEDAIGPL
jgi:histidine ammonia-lyase